MIKQIKRKTVRAQSGTVRYGHGHVEKFGPSTVIEIKWIWAISLESSYES